MNCAVKLLCTSFAVLAFGSFPARSSVPPQATAVARAAPKLIPSGQLVAGASPDEIRAVNLRLLASGRIIHRFFETSPLSPSGRYVVLTRFPSEDQSPKPGDSAQIVLVDLKDGTQRVVATSKGWEFQLGAQAQWGATDGQLFYNDVDPTTWQAFAVALDARTGKRRRLSGTVFMATLDGRKLVSMNLRTARYVQRGYGVIVPETAFVRPEGASTADGVFVTDVGTGRSRLVASFKSIVNSVRPTLGIDDPQKYKFFVFQTKVNPQGTRILISFNWSPVAGGVARRRSAITMKIDGTDIRTAITADQWGRGGHHIAWTPDGEHVSMNLNVDAEPGLELISVRYDGKGMKTLFDPGSGHPSLHPGGLPLIVTDAYPDEPMADGKGTVPIRLINLATHTEIKLAEVFVSTTTGEFRIDPHPTWDRSGRFVIFNGFVGKTRNVWMIDVTTFVDAASVRRRVAN